MPEFGARSKANLAECDQRLQLVFNHVIKYRDCSIIEGYRGEAEQNHMFKTGMSKLKFPQGKHNVSPSLAVDVVPWYATKPHIRWNDTAGFYEFAQFVMGAASVIGVELRWGGDWDGDGDRTDQSFHDLPHWEIR